MKSLTDVISGIVLLGLCGIGAYSVSTLPEADLEHLGPGAFPTMILVLLGIVSLILIIKSIRSKVPSKTYWPEPRVFKKILLFIGLFYLYLIALTGLGDLFASMENPPFTANGAFSISTASFLLIALPLLGRRNRVEILAVAGITTVTLVGVFSGFFQVLLP